MNNTTATGVMKAMEAVTVPAVLASETVPHDNIFIPPKGLAHGSRLLWTRQSHDLANLIDGQEGHVGVTDNCFILSGPSGVGKSCIAISVALYLRRAGKVVLYINDCREFCITAKSLSCAEDGLVSRGIPSEAAFFQTIVSELKALLAHQNPDNEDLRAAINGVKSLSSLARTMNEYNAVFIADEQGLAYSWLKEDRLLPAFWFLEPNAWLNTGQKVRMVLAGSIQTEFESSLNGEYHGCISYVSPLEPNEAQALSILEGWELDMEFYCNNTPREMKHLHVFGSIPRYMNARVTKMNHVLNEKVAKVFNKADVARVLTYLFVERSLGNAETTYIPFLDLGFVYRKESAAGMIEAFPLCLPAQKALLAIWSTVEFEDRIESLESCIANSDGKRLEGLVFTALITKYALRASKYLPLTKLGALSFQEPYQVSIDDVYTATCTAAETADDICRVHRLAKSRDLTYLYHCAKGTKTVDFCVLTPHAILAIQVSLQSLTDHEKPDEAFLRSIGAFNSPVRNQDWRFVFITTSPERHPIIALQSLWNGVDVSKIRIVDANNWLGRAETR